MPCRPCCASPRCPCVNESWSNPRRVYCLRHCRSLSKCQFVRFIPTAPSCPLLVLALTLSATAVYCLACLLLASSRRAATLPEHAAWSLHSGSWPILVLLSSSFSISTTNPSSYPSVAPCFPHLPLLSQRQLIPSLPPSRARARAPWPCWTPALPLLGANASHRAAPALPCFLSSACSTKPIPFSCHHGHHQAVEAAVAPCCPNLLPVRTSTVLPLPCAASAVRAP